MEASLEAYHAWRATLTPVDQLRLDYLMQDGLPLIVDIIKAAAKPQVMKIPVIGGVADDAVNAALDAAGGAAVRALVGH